MAGMKPEHREAMRETTREAAVALVEDLQHIRSVLEKRELDRGEVRRISNIVRRLVLDGGGDLPMIAAPRIGRLMLRGPDNRPFYLDNRSRPYAFFASGGVRLFGVIFRGVCMAQGQGTIKDFKPDATVDLRIDNFISQRVICVRDRWITRKDAIRHIAHNASGVHSQTPGLDEEHIIRARIHAQFGLNQQAGAALSFYDAAFNPGPPKFVVNPHAIDVVLMEVLVTAKLIVESPAVHELEAAIRDECGL